MARSVKNLGDKIKNVEKLPEHADRILFLRKKLTYLENRLSYAKEQDF
ncbi:MAG: hypothetical protein ACI9V8_001292 [Urechidicola sp.]